MKGIPVPSEHARLWSLDPGTVYLNHGSFGACPKAILDKQQEYRQRMEAAPVRFLVRDMIPQYERSRMALAEFIHADPGSLVFVQNATAGVNTVFRSLDLGPDDEILFTSHIYGACRKLLEFISHQTGARLVEAVYDFPIASPELIVESILSRVSPRTRIALIDHITSATALIHPVEILVGELEKRGIDTMIDGAHALGSIPLDMERIGAAYYTANCHKWLCAPKGVAVLHVRADRQKGLVPPIISHAGYDAEPFTERFFWPGTYDPTAVLCVADSIEFLNSALPGGWPALMKRNRELCLEARELICAALQLDKPCPDGMIASMATFPLPAAADPLPVDYKSFEPLQDLLFDEYHIEIPVWKWSSPPSRLFRISAQLYNSKEQFGYLAEALPGLFRQPS
jgi:isopenicillin-N epimerase